MASLIPSLSRFVVLLGLLGGPGVQAGAPSEPTAVAVLSGEPFTGKVVATVRQPGGERQGRAETGTADARLVDVGGGRTRLVVVGHLRRPSDAGFNIVGVAAHGGWQGRAEGWTLDIARDGAISGGGIEAHHRLRFSGRATAERLNLRVETELLQPDARGLPAGSVVAFEYKLRRPAASQAARAAASGNSTAATGGGNKTCKRTVWQTRNVTTPLGGMQMIRVPVCRD